MITPNSTHKTADHAVEAELSSSSLSSSTAAALHENLQGAVVGSPPPLFAANSAFFEHTPNAEAQAHRAFEIIKDPRRVKNAQDLAALCDKLNIFEAEDLLRCTEQDFRNIAACLQGVSSARFLRSMGFSEQQ